MLIHIFVELFETIAFAFWNTQTPVIVCHFEERKSSNYMYVFVFWYCYYVGVTYVMSNNFNNYWNCFSRINKYAKCVFAIADPPLVNIALLEDSSLI